jgi:DNA-binding MarR family transcriptional regulator
MPKTQRLTLSEQELEYKLDESVGFMLTITERKLKAFLRDSIAGEEFNYGMWFFLRVLYEEDGLTQKELSERVGMMQPTAVTAIKNMQSRGLVRVETDETDRRRTYIHLTPAGKRVGKRMLPLLRQINDVALQGITKAEFDTLRTVLRKIRSNVDKALVVKID